ncbi:inositol oxygenase [Phaffia rhodozyma]|uniref:Inositol oxygenase n=1 Tax=Phaffia rhodozyma TaxID=264483 RepID=A0A0F7SS87_PHARH|nr:inositol oxygenase [Phaffia rhodozyma]
MLSVQNYVREDDPVGRRFDQVSDNIDAINVGKLWQCQQAEEAEQNAYAASQFDAEKDHSSFRHFADENETPKNFYREQHTKQTVEYNIEARKEAFAKPRATLSIWEAMELLNTLIDASDPDTDNTQIQHLLQTAEAIRKDGKPEWMQVTGLIHDLGKLLYFFGSEGQWDVVGDTFVVGCKVPLEHVVYPDTFEANPDINHPIYSTKYGIYKPACGLSELMLSWGHDEYLYHVMKEQSTLPKAALHMIRFHSFYPWHRERAYTYFESDEDKEALKDVLAFNPYDLYSKSDSIPVKEELKPYYLELIAKFFPDKINW